MLLKTDFIKIEQALRQKGVYEKETLEELIDHVSSEIESHMSLGVEREDAVQYVLRELDHMDLKKINKNAILQKIKKPILMGMMTAFLASCFLFMNPWNQSTPQNAVEDKWETIEHQVTTVALLDEPPYLWPIEGDLQTISSEYGQRMHPYLKKMRHHNGVDIRAKLGTAILAPAPAIVVEVGTADKYGKYIILKHDEIYQTKFCHLSEIDVVEGQKIDVGELIGKVGSTGLTTSPHLHYEVYKDGKHVNPKDYLNRT